MDSISPKTDDFAMETSSSEGEENPRNQPPAQDSPKHILNLLNDDCIQTIFGELTNLQDFLSVAETCTRFQSNAKRCFRVLFNKVYIDESSDTRFSITVSKLPSFLDIFGKSVTSIGWLCYKDRISSDDDVLKMIAKHCVSLKKFVIQGHDIDLSKCLKFNVLEEFEMTFGTIRNFNLHSEIRSLKLRDVRIVDVNWLIQSFSNLLLIEFFKINAVTDNVLMGLIRSNSQLLNIKIAKCRNVTPSMFKRIVRHVPKLREFTFSACVDQSMKNFDKKLLHLSNLKDLRSLRILGRNFSASQLIRKLIEDGRAIEDLAIDGAESNLAEEIGKLKKLKNLTLIAANITEDSIINLIQQLPALENIVTTSVSLTPIGINRILEAGTKLMAMSIFTYHLAIDSNAYKPIYALAKDRVQVIIVACTGKIDLPSNEITTEKCKWVDIKQGIKFPVIY